MNLFVIEKMFCYWNSRLSCKEYATDDFYFVAADKVTTKTVVLSSFQFEHAFKLIENMLNIYLPCVSYVQINFTLCFNINERDASSLFKSR
jgi:hypothetical protein